MSEGSHTQSGWRREAGLTLGALGVVFGDIGTSPLYALKSALGAAGGKGIPAESVIGLLSLVIWALIVTVTAKYVMFLMRADNKGEGGTLSLMALAREALGKHTTFVFFLGVAGAALFSGDAIITPAISVLSAVEGLKQVNDGFAPYVLPLTAAILVVLFVVQKRGTAGVATFFGPIMVAFFLVIGLLGLWHIFEAPRVLMAFDPLEGLRYVLRHGSVGFAVLGAVFLAVTGAEALYADMGHFGRAPIAAAWTFFVLPALLLCYLGQGAMVIARPETIVDPYYLMAPHWALAPMVALSTAATVIASQAVITGAFSLTRQAVQLGLLPRFEIVHTSETMEGQIYIPRLNRLLLAGVLVLVFAFKSSDALGNAYGIAVSGTMIVTTSLAYVVVTSLWKWPVWRAALTVAPFLVVDSGFFASNLQKVFDGGWVPLMLAMLSFLTMWTWMRGAAALEGRVHRDAIPLVELIAMLAKSKPTRVPGTAV
ncbi:MAG: KUP/HAK/KT family potassium transporter, partial [Hyphomicrobiales bacterium]|nr:KUP/HAK/KT family potassium transporter [Hyphomicrobiales bacterium]